MMHPTTPECRKGPRRRSLGQSTSFVPGVRAAGAPSAGFHLAVVKLTALGVSSGGKHLHSERVHGLWFTGSWPETGTWSSDSGLLLCALTMYGIPRLSEGEYG